MDWLCIISWCLRELKETTTKQQPCNSCCFLLNLPKSACAKKPYAPILPHCFLKPFLVHTLAAMLWYGCCSKVCTPESTHAVRADFKAPRDLSLIAKPSRARDSSLHVSFPTSWHAEDRPLASLLIELLLFLRNTKSLLIDCVIKRIKSFESSQIESFVEIQ